MKPIFILRCKGTKKNAHMQEIMHFFTVKKDILRFKEFLHYQNGI